MSQQYCAKADLWSVGTIIFQCLTGHAPFQAATPPALKRLYERNKELRPRIPAYCSPLLKDLLVGLLKRNARDRIDFGLLWYSFARLNRNGCCEILLSFSYTFFLFYGNL